MVRIPKLARGFSLIEILVGVAIGLIGTVVIMQVFAVNENVKRTTGGVGDAQVNGTLALYALERDLRMAGYGITDGAALGCNKVQWSYKGAPGAAFPLAPVVITDGGTATPDQFTVLYSTASQRAIPSKLDTDMALPDNTLSAAAPITVDPLNVAGFAANDLLVLADPPAACAMVQVTQVAGKVLEHEPTSDFNPSGGILAFNQGARVFNMGGMVYRRYSVSADRALVVEDIMNAAGGSKPQTIASDIVDMRVQYLKSATSDSNDRTWSGSADKAVPTTTAGWQQVIALRIGLVARSGNFERPINGKCAATTVVPSWGDGGLAEKFAMVEKLDQWDCYRYRVFETVVPLRNMIWRVQ